MPTIYDDDELPCLENDQGTGLKDALKISHRGDFCVGYFNLRGWKTIDRVGASWLKLDNPLCRLLVGMQLLPQNDLNLLVSNIKISNDRITREKLDFIINNSVKYRMGLGG